MIIVLELDRHSDPNAYVFENEIKAHAFAKLNAEKYSLDGEIEIKEYEKSTVYSYSCESDRYIVFKDKGVIK